MRIAFITHAFSRTGGVGKYALSLAHAFQQDGQTPIIVHDDASVVDSGLPYPCKRFPNFSDYKSASQKEQTQAVMNFLRLQKPDIVHVQASMNYALEAEIRSQFPAVKSLHVYDFCPSGTKYHYANQKACVHKPGLLCLPRMVYKRCTMDINPATLTLFYERARKALCNDKQYKKIFVASQYVRDQAADSGFAPSRLQVLPYYAEPVLPAALPPLDPTEKIILFTGRIVREKGLDKLLSAVSYMKQKSGWKLVVDGGGSDLKRSQALAKKLGLENKVEWAGWLKLQDHQAMYEQASIVVIPSIWPEPFGLVGIEAMTFGKPVVAFRVGGIPDWLEDLKTGFLIEPYNTQSMAEKIELLLKDEKLCAEMGARGKERAGKFYSTQDHLRQLKKIYAEIIN